ncbi:20612_t:CDS:1, partial [Gigaspora rosea]
HHKPTIGGQLGNAQNFAVSYHSEDQQSGKSAPLKTKPSCPTHAQDCTGDIQRNLATTVPGLARSIRAWFPGQE